MRTYTSTFKSPFWKQQLANWQQQQLQKSSTDFKVSIINTAYGQTQVLSSNISTALPHLVFLPGFRTCGLYWDICDSTSIYADKFQVHLIDVIGQPSMSSGLSPNVKGPGYGEWLMQLLDGLGIRQASFAGASFGGQLIMKLSQVAPDKIERAFLCNPAGLASVSFWGIWANIPMMLNASDQNIEKMMQKVAFGAKHGLNSTQYQSLFDNIKLSVKGFKSGAQFPYSMKKSELSKLSAPTYLMLGTNDLMFNYKKQIARAQKVLPNLAGIEIFENIGHGIEVEPVLHQKILSILLDGDPDLDVF